MINPFQQGNDNINSNSITDYDRDESIDSFRTDERSSKGISIETKKNLVRIYIHLFLRTFY